MTTYFKFNGQVYEQIKGTSNGSVIPGLIAETVKVFLPLIEPKLLVRYVDDKCLRLERSGVEQMQRLLNNVFPLIRFEREEINVKHPFLDVLVRRSATDHSETQVYRKPTHAGQILNFISNHPLHHKRNCVQTLFKRIRTHCSTSALRRAEEKYLFSSVLRSNY